MATLFVIMSLQLLLSKEGVFIHVTTAQADEDVLLPGQVFIWSKVQYNSLIFLILLTSVHMVDQKTTNVQC